MFYFILNAGSIQNDFPVAVFSKTVALLFYCTAEILRLFFILAMNGL